MQPLRTRLTCRAHNRFTPSIALWQHFVVPNRPNFHKQRHASSAAEAVYESGLGHGNLPDSPGASRPEHVESATTATAQGNEQQELKIRRLTTVKGTRPKKISQDPPSDVDKLLAATKAAFKQAKDYEGVVVKPMVNPQPIKESQLPWCFKLEERDISGIDRYGFIYFSIVCQRLIFP